MQNETPIRTVSLKHLCMQVLHFLGEHKHKMRCLYCTIHKTLTHEVVAQNGAFPPTATIFAFYHFFLSITVQRCLQFSSMPHSLSSSMKCTYPPSCNKPSKQELTMLFIFISRKYKTLTLFHVNFLIKITIQKSCLNIHLMYNQLIYGCKC